MERTRTGSAVALAKQLAGEFRANAAELDRTGEFPHAHYDRMRETGYLRAPVPAELGGLGAGLLEMAQAQQELARGCASTALAVNMHLFQVGGGADAWRNGGPTEPLLRRVANEGIVLASTAAEALVAGNWTTPTTAAKVDGGYRIQGRKYFCSQAPGMSLIRVNAMDAETGEVLAVAIPANAEGVRYEETWDTTGMRATASHDLVLDNVLVPDGAIGGRMPAEEPLAFDGFASVATWFLCLMSSVYLGIAEEARAEATKATGKGNNSQHRAEALTETLLGELEVAYVAALAARDQLAGEIDADRADPQRALVRAMLVKEIVIPNAIRTVEKAVQIAGGKAFFRTSPLERLARDVRAGIFHPPAAPVSFQMIGKRVQRGLSVE